LGFAMFFGQFHVGHYPVPSDNWVTL
jgi:hypothetical protein